MRYQLEPKYRKYVQGYGFLSFARKFGDKYGKKLMDTASKTGIDAERNSRSNRIFDWKKIADKITSVGKSKSKEKKGEEIYRRDLYSTRKETTNH